MHGSYSYLDQKDSDVFAFTPDVYGTPEYRFYIESFDIDCAFLHFIDPTIDGKVHINVPISFKLYRREPGMPNANEWEVASRNNGEFTIHPERSYVLKYRDTPIWVLDNQKLLQTIYLASPCLRTK